MSADDETIEDLSDDDGWEDSGDEPQEELVFVRPLRASDARRRIDRYLEDRRLREVLGNDEWDVGPAMRRRRPARRPRGPRLSG